MKKNLFVIAAVATAMVSCAESEMKTSFQDFEEAISFEETINKATKAEITNEQALAAAGGFKVWGYKDKSVASGEPTWANKSMVFTATVVTASAEANPTWSYENKKYWDKTSSYKFFAGGPVNHTNGTLAWANDLFTVTGAQADKASESLSDFIIDRIANFERGDSHSTKVSFDFHHIMAKVTFIVKNNISDPLTITGLKVKGFKESGSFAQTKTDGTWASLDASEWTASGNAAEYTLVNSNASSDAIALSTEGASSTFESYIMIPQVIAANNLVFTVDFKIGDEEFTDQEGKIATAQTWGTDSHTTYTILVGPDAIEFDVTSICDFCVTASADAVIK